MPLKNPDRVEGGEEAGSIEKWSGARDRGEGAEEGDVEWGIRGLETGVMRECSISEGGGQIVQWRCMCRRSPRRGESQCYSRGGSSKSESCLEL